MSLGRAHEAALLTAALAAILLALAGGEFPLFAWAVALVPPLSFFLKEKDLAAPTSSGTALGLASLGLAVAEVVTRGIDAVVLGGGILLLGLMVARVLTRQSLAHDTQVLLLSLLLVLAGSVLNVGPSFIVLFLLFALSAVIALSTRQLLVGNALDDTAPTIARDPVRARRDVVTPVFVGFLTSVAVATLLATSVIFVAFPRLGITNFGLNSTRGGRFPSAVSLHGQPRGSAGGGEVIARVRGVPLDAFQRGLYLRGSVYDVIDERGFAHAPSTPTFSRRGMTLSRAPVESRYEVTLQPVAGELIFSLGDATTLRTLSGGRANPNQVSLFQGFNERSELLVSHPLASPLRYEVRGGIASPGFVVDETALKATDDFSHYLALPENMDPRVRELAERVVGDATDPAEKAARLRTHLLREFTYTLLQPSGSATHPLRSFLFETKSGHCEYFSAAFALLLRSVDIPSRVVGGYQGGLLDDDAEYVLFLGRNAHAWVEWYFPNKGWVVDDPTPAASAPRKSLAGLDLAFETWRRFWDDRVVDYSVKDQVSALRGVKSFFSRFDATDADSVVKGVIALLGIFVTVVVGWRWLRRRQTVATTPATRLTSHLIDTIARLRGRSVQPGETVREAARTGSVEADHAHTIARAVALYEGARFSSRSVSEAEVDEIIGALSALVTDPEKSA